MVGAELWGSCQSSVLGAFSGDRAADGACVVARVLERLQVECEARRSFASSRAPFYFQVLQWRGSTPDSHKFGWSLGHPY